MVVVVEVGKVSMSTLLKGAGVVCWCDCPGRSCFGRLPGNHWRGDGGKRKRRKDKKSKKELEEKHTLPPPLSPCNARTSSCGSFPSSAHGRQWQRHLAGSSCYLAASCCQLLPPCCHPAATTCTSSASCRPNGGVSTCTPSPPPSSIGTAAPCPSLTRGHGLPSACWQRPNYPKSVHR